MREMSYYLPSLNKIFRSWRIRNGEFLRENTLHGFPYFVNPRRPKWERIFWFVATMASIGSAIGIMITIYQTFQSEPTLTGLDITTTELVSHFPSVTVCNVMPNFKFGRYEVDSAHYKMMYNWPSGIVKGVEPNIELNGETYSQFYFRTTPKCEDLYENCSFGGEDVPCGELFEKKIVSRGVCCFLEATEITKDDGPRTIAFDSTVYPISLDLLGKNEKPPRRDANRGYLLETGTTFKLGIIFTYSTSGVSTLPKSQRLCHYSNEESSYSACVHKCKKNVFLKKCGCIPWYMMIDDETTECSRSQYNCLADNSNVSTTSDCNCYLPCNHTTYEFLSIQTSGNNRVDVSIPNWPSMIFRREVRFGWLDLLVSFGGIAGLFVGYSLLTTVEFTYYLSLRAYCGAVLDQSDRAIGTKPKKSKKKSRRRVINVASLQKNYFDYVE